MVYCFNGYRYIETDYSPSQPVLESPRFRALKIYLSGDILLQLDIMLGPVSDGVTLYKMKAALYKMKAAF